MIYEKAIFAAGCFWGIEETFSNITGVFSTKVGYTGGNTDNPTYEQVCGQNTGHAESVLIEFDPIIVTYESLLESFWKCQDPTTLNRQGLDIGSQYRSIIFYYNLEQKNKAIRSKTDISSQYSNQVVTEIIKVNKFYMAEEYHQQYIQKMKNKD